MAIALRLLKIVLLGAFALAGLRLQLPVSHAQTADRGIAFTKAVQPFFAEHCYGCHQRWRERERVGNSDGRVEHLSEV